MPYEERKMLDIIERLRCLFQSLDRHCRSLRDTDVTKFQRLLERVKQEYRAFLFQSFATDQRGYLAPIINGSVNTLLDFGFTPANLYLEAEKCLIVWEMLFYYMAMLLKLFSDSDVEQSKIASLNSLADTTCAASKVWIQNENYGKALFHIASWLQLTGRFGVRREEYLEVFEASVESYRLMKGGCKGDDETLRCAIQTLLVRRPDPLCLLSSIKTVLFGREKELEIKTYACSVNIRNGIFMCRVLEACVIFPMRVFSLFTRKIENRFNVAQKMYFFTQKLLLRLDSENNVKDIVFVAGSALDVLSKNEDISPSCLLQVLDFGLKAASIDMMIEDNHKGALVWYQHCHAVCLLIKRLTNAWDSVHDYVLLKMSLCCIELDDQALGEKILRQMIDRVTDSTLSLYLALQVALRTSEPMAEYLLTFIDAFEESRELSHCLLASYSTAVDFSTSPRLVRSIMEKIMQHVPHDQFPALYWEPITHLAHDYVTEIERGNLDYVRLLSYFVQKSYYALTSSESEITSDCNISLRHWFRKLCWHVASDERISVQMKFKISLQCCGFITTCPELDHHLFLRFKSCLTMVFSTGLQIANLETDPDTKAAHLRKMISIFRLVKELRTKFPQIRRRQIKRLFKTYLFEVYVLLKHRSVDDMMQRALEVNYMNAESLERMVNTYYTHGGEDFHLMSRVLWKAIHLLRHLPQVDFVRISRICRFIIQHAFHGDELFLDQLDKEAYFHCQGFLSLIRTSENRYPQDEVVWLMKKTWNYGIHNVVSARMDQAQRWFFMAQSFLQELTLQRPLYEQYINDIIALLFE